jgi:NAD(P)-dependent dehydrogenase (short-subunit alcohol dehydrogenase family)
MVETAVSHFGKLDIVIANAGLTLFGDFFYVHAGSVFPVLQVTSAARFSWRRPRPTK